MSAEQRAPLPARSADERPRIARTVPELTTSCRSDSSLQQPFSDSGRLEPPLAYRIERTRLRARVAALERAVETSEQRRQDIIEQYERLLADRDHVDSVSESSGESSPLLSRLIGR